MMGRNFFCEACKKHEEKKDILEQIERDLRENILQGGYDF